MTSPPATSTQGLPQVPLHAPLSARYRDTFAFPTIKDRCPVILCKVIDHLHRQRNHIARELGPEAGQGLYTVVEQLSKLRYEMQTDKPITDIEDGAGNAAVWNDYLQRQKQVEEKPSWFSSAWMWVECYMYRRMLQSVNMTGVPKLRCVLLYSSFFGELIPTVNCRDFDFFRHQKEEGFHGSLGSMRQLSSWLLPKLRAMEQGEEERSPSRLAELWHVLVQVSLWGNRCDLSISAGSRAVATGDPVTALAALRRHILADTSPRCWQHLAATQPPASVSIVMDNCGFELFTDLCLADFLVTSGAAARVRLRIKDQPWFVSDTTAADLEWSLAQLAGEQHTAQLAARWRHHLEAGVWSVHSDGFWTHPHTFHEMADCDPNLYNDLSNDALVIFKGDLNYRKLVGDLNWQTTVPFSEALKGFRPGRVLAVRTAKADVMVGLEAGQAETAAEEDKEWMVTGRWGVLQYADKL